MNEQDRKAAYIEALREHGTFSAASERLGIDRRVVHTWRQKDAEFDAQCVAIRAEQPFRGVSVLTPVPQEPVVAPLPFTTFIPDDVRPAPPVVVSRDEAITQALDAILVELQRHGRAYQEALRLAQQLQGGRQGQYTDLVEALSRQE